MSLWIRIPVYMGLGAATVMVAKANGLGFWPMMAIWSWGMICGAMAASAR